MLTSLDSSRQFQNEVSPANLPPGGSQATERGKIEEGLVSKILLTFHQEGAQLPLRGHAGLNVL